MAFSPQDNVRATARELYEDGLALDAIARTVEVSVMSVLRWRRDHAEAGRPWLRPGEPDPIEKIRLHSVEGAFLERPRPAVAPGDSPRGTLPT